MLSIQIKSILRNKVNIEYVIAIIVIFVFLNIGINLTKMVDYFYDTKVKEFMDEESLYDARSLFTSDPQVVLTEEQQEEIKMMKYVEDFRIDTIEIPNQKLSCYVIVVDDWKHCDYIKKIFDKKGIELESSGGSVQYDAMLESYKNVINISKVVKYLDILIVLCITILIYNNIISNQQENLKLLKILGYNSYKIKKIIYVDLLAITLIGWIIGIIILFFLTKLIKMEINIISSIMINVLIYSFSLIVSTIKKLGVID